MANTTTYIDRIQVPNGSDTITARLVDTITSKVFKTDLMYDVTTSSYVSDKSYDDVLNAIYNGDYVCIIDNDSSFVSVADTENIQAPFVATGYDQDDNTYIIFEVFLPNDKLYCRYILYSDNTVDVDYGNITSITPIASPENNDYITIADYSDSDKIKRGIKIGTDTTKYLRNDGTWVVPDNGGTQVSIIRYVEA